MCSDVRSVFQGHTLAPSSLCLRQARWLAVRLGGPPSFMSLVSKDRHSIASRNAALFIVLKIAALFIVLRIAALFIALRIAALFIALRIAALYIALRIAALFVALRIAALFVAY